MEAVPAAEPSIEGMIRAQPTEQLSQLGLPTDIHHPILGMPPSSPSVPAKAASGQCYSSLAGQCSLLRPDAWPDAEPFQKWITLDVLRVLSSVKDM